MLLKNSAFSQFAKLLSIFLILLIISFKIFARQNPGAIITGKDIAIAATKYGRVRGYIDDGIFALKGIFIVLARPLMDGTKEACVMADKISTAWINFVKTGNPNGQGLPKWEPYNNDKGAMMIFDNECKIFSHHNKDQVNFVGSAPAGFGSR